MKLASADGAHGQTRAFLGTQATIVETGLSRSGIKKSVRELVDAGMIHGGEYSARTRTYTYFLSDMSEIVIEDEFIQESEHDE